MGGGGAAKRERGGFGVRKQMKASQKNKGAFLEFNILERRKGSWTIYKWAEGGGGFKHTTGLDLTCMKVREEWGKKNHALGGMYP